MIRPRDVAIVTSTRMPVSARIPYIGPDYPTHRIAAVAINSRDCGQAGDEIKATAQVLDQLKQGHRDYGNRSFFHYHVASVVHTAIRALSGEAIDERELPDPAIAAESLTASARLQAVQCSPHSSSRRSPTGAMTRRIPSTPDSQTPRVTGGASRRAPRTQNPTWTGAAARRRPARLRAVAPGA